MPFWVKAGIAVVFDAWPLARHFETTRATALTQLQSTASLAA
jgi:hypothetical protein